MQGTQAAHVQECLVDGVFLDRRAVAPQDGKQLVGNLAVVTKISGEEHGVRQELPGLPHRHPGLDAGGLCVIGLGHDTGILAGHDAHWVPLEVGPAQQFAGSVEAVGIHMRNGTGPVGHEHGGSAYLYFRNWPTTMPKISSCPCGRMTGYALLAGISMNSPFSLPSVLRVNSLSTMA